MRSEVKEAEDSGGKRERKKGGIQRAAMWWECGTQEGAPRLGSPRGTQETGPCSKGLAGRTGAARSCRYTANPSIWQGAQKSGGC